MLVLKQRSETRSAANVRVALSGLLSFTFKGGFLLLFLSCLNVAKNLKDQDTEFNMQDGP